MIEAQTHVDTDITLDTPFALEEVEAAINHLKKDSSGGPDSLSPHHLRHAGSFFKEWLCKIFNSITDLEAIPASFKAGIVIPVYKGKGKDPLSPKSYRGITLTSVMAKVLEFLLLDRILPVLNENNLPQLTQTAYQKGVSCSDAIFSCQEVISKFIREGDSVYSCFYDLASAFDTVEYPILLDHLKNAGISGKAWRLIKDWYLNVQSSVRMQGTTSAPFQLSRGVRQGSVLSPVLFLLVMDPILLELKSKSCGLSLCGLYLGAFSHADDIRSLSTSIATCKQQIATVSDFASSRGLVLSAEKCEAVVSPANPPTMCSFQVGEINIPVTNSARCLGAWWTPNLSCTKWIDVNIKKARRAFFARGSGVFHGTLNPLSSKSIVECCVLPVLLYGAESWILNKTLLQKLEPFQAELAKRILRLPKHTSNHASLLALQWPSVRSRVLMIKLTYLLKVIRNDISLSSRVFRSLAASDVEALQLVRQCRFLELTTKSNFTTSVLTTPEDISLPSMKKDLIKQDQIDFQVSATNHRSQHYVKVIAASPEGSWPKVWDTALERGAFGTTCSLAVLRLLSLHPLSDNRCPVADCTHEVGSEPLCVHFLAAHTNLRITVEDCVSACINCTDDIFVYGQTLHRVFKSIIWN